jgi:N4-gp56 family major capsid protein
MASALNSTSDIFTAVALVNAYNADETGKLAPIAPETFYQKQLLDTIRLDADNYVYFKVADSMPIQDRADKLMLRRWSALQAHTVPLAEGVPPLSDKGSMEKYELEAFQYGRYMEFTDKVDFKVVDPVVAHFTKEYSLVALETLDLLAREALLTNAQKFYAGGATSPDGLTFASLPKYADLAKIVLAMKKLLVKPRGANYLCIGSPEFFYDMMTDEIVKLYMTVNQSTGNVFGGGKAPIPALFGLSFEETMCVPTSGEYVDADGNKRLKVYTGTIGGADEKIYTSAGTGGVEKDLIETDVAQFATRAAGYVKDPRTGMDASYMPADTGVAVWTLPASTKEFKMQHILILGKDALARTGLAGQDNAKMYVKPLGSTGVLDPIDQRQSIGFKINSVGFGSIRPEAIYDYICVPSQVNI